MQLSFFALLSSTVFFKAVYHASSLSPDPGEEDEITNLPGITFQTNFRQYAGYLNSTNNIQLFYWLVRSQNQNAAKQPLILWLNGGPGCASAGGLLLQIGPFHHNRDGKTLYENVFSWNKFAHVLFLDQPATVGFSYAKDRAQPTSFNEITTAEQSYYALYDFFHNKFPSYASNDFYVAGVSFGGVFVPTLSSRIIQGINTKEFPNILKGIIIGNGLLSLPLQMNSVFQYYYFHGLIGPATWNNLTSFCCPQADCVLSTTCDFYSHLNRENLFSLQSDGTLCGNTVGSLYVELSSLLGNNVYNLYEDCYDSNFLSPANSFEANVRKSVAAGTIDYARLLAYDTTDPFNGYNCWSEQAMGAYMNTAAVKKALHVAPAIFNNTWIWCPDLILTQFTLLNDRMDTFFDTIIAKSNISILIYNGDVDTACNFLGDRWFVEQVAANHSLSLIDRFSPWYFHGQHAGYTTRYQRITLATVKGAGHEAAESRPGPVQQLVAAFVSDSANYSRNFFNAVDLAPLLTNTDATFSKATYNCRYDALLFTIFALLTVGSNYLLDYVMW